MQGTVRLNNGAEISIKLLDKQHDRGVFDCVREDSETREDDERLNNFLRLYSTQYSKRDMGQTYVATLTDDNVVIGYYTICASCIARERMVSSEGVAPPHPVPSIHLARLATDKTYDKQGLGRALMWHLFGHVATTSEVVGVQVVDVVAKHEKARSFYLKYGFVSIVDDDLHLYLSVKKIRRMLIA